MAKPKLALIPSAQGDKFYSVLPSSGVGDFDFFTKWRGNKNKLTRTNRNSCRWSIKIKLSFD